MTYDAERSHEFTRFIAGFTDNKPVMLDTYRFIGFDLAAIVDEIIISPYATDVYEEEVRHAISSFDASVGDLVQLSELSEKRYAKGL